MFIVPEQVSGVSRHFRGLGRKFSIIFPRLRLDLQRIHSDAGFEEYVIAAFFSGLLLALLFFSLIFLLLLFLGGKPAQITSLSGLVGFVILLLSFMVFLLYPGILAGKMAEQVDRDLIYVLKDLLLELSSGGSIYNALIEIARSDYDVISEEFARVVKKVNGGVPIENALEELSLATSSDNLKTSLWQIVNALKAGSELESALREIIKDLTMDQRNRIRNYAAELNIIVLIYMLFAVVVPTIFTTLIIIIGPFMGVELGVEIFFIILPLSFFIQIVLVEFIKSRRPVVHM
ncbi:type II secretion system F family protein [Candidatus Altiarchaeota archaeon]